MPLWLFLTVLAAELVACFAIGTGMLRLSGRIWRAPRLTLRRALTSQILLLPVNLAFYVIDFQRLPILVQLASVVISLGITIAVVRAAAGTGWLRAIGIWAVAIGMSLTAAAGLAFVQKRTIIESFWLPTEPMSPTLLPGDRFFVDRLRTPERWDVVAFHFPMEPTSVHVQRIVGLPGETVEIVKGDILINGARVAKPPAVARVAYAGGVSVYDECHGCTGSPMTLGPHEYFVLGDNTERSRDSRYWGPAADGRSQPGALPRRDIVGVVRFVYSPSQRMGIVR